MTGRRLWKIREAALDAVSPALIEAADHIPLLAKLLAIRGITDPAEARAFLNIQDYKPTPPSEFPDMAKAVDRIREAIDRREPILVYGDFDVDGITGTSVLMETLTRRGAIVSQYVPDRHSEGHGMNSAALCRLISSRQAKLVVTTDTGITNFNEVTLLNGLNVETIITDHHELPEHLPPAFAVLNPKLLPESSPFVGMAGVGVAYQLSKALNAAMEAPGEDTERLLDLVAIGTVVDMVPLRRENRYLVWRGLQRLNTSPRTGVRALLEEAHVDAAAVITSQTLGFTLGPRLNAIGRLARADDAVTLLTTEDTEKAKQLSAKLEQLNRKRKLMVDECLMQAETHLLSSGELAGQKAIILSSNDWNQGIVGLVASKLIERYQRPCFIGHVDPESQEVRFSARSIEGFDMHFHLSSLEDLFIRWGGHSGAAGFAIAQKHQHSVKTRLFELCNQVIDDQQLVPVTTVDMRLTPDQINPFLIELIGRMEPFGMGNPYPVFALEGVTLGAQRMLGESQNHLKIVLNGGGPGKYLEAIHWNWGADRPKLNPANKYRMAFTPELNTYNGSAKVQLLIKDLQDESTASAARVTPVVIAPRSAIAPMGSTPASSAVDMAEETFHWIDHRGRDELESFMQQMFAPPRQPQQRPMRYRVFCEGTQRLFPLPVGEDQFCGRHPAPEALIPDMHLVLWDLPPDMITLTGLILRQQPTMLHLAGGKYQKIPLYRPEREFLDGMFKVLQRQARQAGGAQFTVAVSQLGMMLSTSQRVVLSALSLMQQLDMVQTVSDASAERMAITILSAPNAEERPIGERIEYNAFSESLQAVHRFREWLMTAPLGVIKSGVAMELGASPRVSAPAERDSHVISLR